MNGFLKAAEFLTQADSDSAASYSPLVQDAKRRLRALAGTRRSKAPTTQAQAQAESTPVTSRAAPKERTPADPRSAGVALTIGGGAVAAAGFATNIALYQQYYRPETNQATYDTARNGSAGAFAAGIAGALVGITGIVLIASAPKAKQRVSFAPGPFTQILVEF